MTPTTPHLIGIYSPEPGSGKTTIANHLVEHGYIRLPFAQTLKSMVILLLQNTGIQYKEAFELVHNHKEAPIPELGPDITARHLLQTLGTDWGRKLVNQNIWRNVWEAQYRHLISFGEPSDIPSAIPESGIPKVVVDDVRFENEAILIERYFGEMWLIERPNNNVDTTVTTHTSEGGLNKFRFNRRIHNSGTVADLYTLVNNILSKSPTAVS